MSPRRSDDEEDENWQNKRSSDIEKLFRWAIAIIGFLILAVCSLAWNTVLEIKTITLTNQSLSTGNAREIEVLRGELQGHISIHTVTWTQEEKEEYKKIKTEAFRRWGYFINTRGGEEILINKPITGEIK